MPSAKELKDELRKLRKEHQKPVSKMRIADVASEIERLKGKREETPAVASTPAEKAPKKIAPKIKDVKEAKASEFPVAPASAPEKKKGWQEGSRSWWLWCCRRINRKVWWKEG